MKHLLAIFGLSVLLTGCFEQNASAPTPETNEKASVESPSTTENTSSDTKTAPATVQQNAEKSQPSDKIEAPAAVLPKVEKPKAEEGKADKASVEKTKVQAVEKAETTAKPEVKAEARPQASEKKTATTEAAPKVEKAAETRANNTKRENPNRTHNAAQAQSKKVRNAKVEGKPEVKLASFAKESTNSTALPKAEREEEPQVSNFSMEELRLGAQRSPTIDEIQHLKRQCRYAYMSEQDVIVNNCSAKKVSQAK